MTWETGNYDLHTIFDADRNEIATVAYQDGSEDNARLIAAAPDLLEACENAANVVENVLGNLEHDLWRIPEPTRQTATTFLRAVVEECREVAARARGEQ